MRPVVNDASAGCGRDPPHRVDELAALEGEILELGAGLGLRSLGEIHRAARASSERRSGADAMEAATGAIRRAEARAPEFLPEPLPPPCEVAPMPTVVASSGMAPHYSPPRLDGGEPGTFWFNLERPTAGTGWDLEVVPMPEGFLASEIDRYIVHPGQALTYLRST